MLQAANHRLHQRPLHFFFVMAFAFCACRQADVPTIADAAPEENTNAAVPNGFVSMELKNEPVDDVLQKLATAAGKSIVIDPDAQVVAHCARISLLTGGTVPVSKALDLVREALDMSALMMTESIAGGMIVRRNAEKPLPASCQKSSASNSPEPDSSASSDVSNKFSEGVHEISETEYEVSRASLDLLLDNSAQLTRAARVIPQTRDGNVVGMKLFGIRAKSPFAALGLKNGDLVTQVQGQPLTTPDEALKIYADIKKAKKVEVTLERQGQPLKIVYQLKDK